LFFLYLFNPHSILDTVGVIGTSTLKYVETEQILFTITCIIVSCIWFLGLRIAGTVITQIDSSEGLLNIFNKCSALFIWGTAVYLFISLI